MRWPAGLVRLMIFRQGVSLGSLWLIAAAIGSGCANFVTSAELPELPIAFVYHTEEQARRRAESLTDNEPKPYDPRSQTENRGVVNVNEFKSYLDTSFGPRAHAKYRGRLALLDPRRAEVRVVPDAQPGAVPHAWSADHQRLLFAQGDPGGQQLYEFDRRNQEVAKLTHGPASHPQGCYTSEGRLVVTVQSVDRSGRYTSRLAIRSASGEIEIVSSGPFDGDPTCSPDGQQVAFVRVFGNKTQIWVRPLTADAAARPVTPGHDPAFSPDGQWLVFSRGSGETSQLWRIRADGAGRTRLGIGSGAEEHRPAVSPDGRFVVYESVLDHRSRLFMRRFDGSDDGVLFSDGDGMHAVW